MTKSIFAINDAVYAAKGLVGVPIQAGEKKPALNKWQRLDALDEDARRRMRAKYADCGIGVLAGARLKTGNRFGFVDVDNGGLVAFVTQVLGGSPCAKRGAKGLTVFVQCAQGVASAKMKPKGDTAPSVEVFATTGQTVLPPTLHPSGRAYEWLGTPLPEMEFEQLPVLTLEKFNLIKAVSTNINAHAIINGGADAKGHGAMLSLTANVCRLSADLVWLADCLNALFHPNYAGDTKAETLAMLKSAVAKGMGGQQGAGPFGQTSSMAQGRKVRYRSASRRMGTLRSSTRSAASSSCSLPTNSWHIRTFSPLRRYRSGPRPSRAKRGCLIPRPQVWR